METIAHHHQLTAALIARIFLGLLFFFQGFDALFNVKVKNVIDAYQSSFANKGIPRFLTITAAWFTSIVEFTGGFMLIIGAFQYAALSLLGLDLIVASVGFGIASPMWDMRYVFPRLALLLFLLVIPPSWNAWSVDGLMRL